MSNIKNILDDKDVSRAITRIANEIIEKNKGVENIIFAGIKTRGIPFSKRLQEKILEIEEIEIPIIDLDISMYRDDLTNKYNEPLVSKKIYDININNKIVILVDDVIYTGRTVRAALDAITDIGRASKIQLAVLVDRGHRELPIRADYVGKNLPTSKDEVVYVRFREIDGEDSVTIE